MIRYANQNDYDAIRSLWELCFPDDSGFNAYFFEHLFDLNNVLLMEIDGCIAAMTQMIPRKLRLAKGTIECCTYIYGACTDPSQRRQHLMSQLLERSFLLDRSLGRACSVLVPAEAWLFGFYEQFGYLPSFFLNTQTVEPIHREVVDTMSMLTEKDVPLLDALYREKLFQHSAYLFRDSAEWKRQLSMFEALGLGCFGILSSSGALDAYAFVWKPEGDTIYAQELFARSEMSQELLLSSIAAHAQVNKVRFSDATHVETQFGCIKRYDDRLFPIAYMNLMMN